MAISEAMRREATLLKQFLHQNLYRHYQVNRMTNKARNIIGELFAAFIEQPNLLPPDYQSSGLGEEQQRRQARQVADYIAGMTDRYAMREHRRLFLVEEI